MSTTIIRPATTSDESFLRRMVFVAWRWDRAWDEADHLAHVVQAGGDSYVDGFGARAGDLGTVTEVDGELVGAAWCRILAGESARAGHVDDAFPELVVAVADGSRGRGVGRRVVEATIESCRTGGVEALSLHVARANHPARRLYERLGFVPVREVDFGTVMLLRLA